MMHIIPISGKMIYSLYTSVFTGNSNGRIHRLSGFMTRELFITMLENSSDQTDKGNGLRRSGLAILLYCFAHAYFIVGSLKNATRLAQLEGAGRFFTPAYGLCWVALFAGGVLLALRRDAGKRIAQVAAGGLSLLLIAENSFFWNGADADTMAILFTLSRPVYGCFLFLMLPALSRDAASAKPVKKWFSFALIAGSALLPWCPALIISFAGNTSFAQTVTHGVLISIFMSLWCALPFGVLMLTIKAWPTPSARTPVFLGGLIGTVVASLYSYGLIWAQNFNSFLMAILQPVVFAGQALGLVIGIACYSFLAKTRRPAKENELCRR